MAYFKDDASIASVALGPARPVQVPTSAGMLRRMAQTYNRIGGLTDRLATVSGIEPFVVLTVWFVESGGEPFVAGKPIIRFENHIFFNTWGASNAAVFDRHFQFGTRAGIAGKKSQNHKFRNPANTPWRRFHNIGQDKEYEVYNFARGLAGVEAAAWSTSWGGPQIMGFNHASIGYARAADLAAAFGADERWQVCGFFDFCENYRNGILRGHIDNKNWAEVARIYNGDATPNGYRKRFADAYAVKGQFNALPSAPAAPVAAAAPAPVASLANITPPTAPRSPVRRPRA